MRSEVLLLSIGVDDLSMPGNTLKSLQNITCLLVCDSSTDRLELGLYEGDSWPTDLPKNCLQAPGVEVRQI